jgi:hypothetical protein
MRKVARRRGSVHGAVMPTSDRAFRALARAQPDVVVGLLRAITPTLLPPHAVPVPDDVAPTHLDGLPPEIGADFAARMTSEELGGCDAPSAGGELARAAHGGGCSGDAGGGMNLW